MRFKITWLMMSFAIICGYHALAQQQLKVRGSVYDNNGRPMQLVTISMISAPDSILIKTDLSDEKGEFEIITRSKGVFILSYSSIGFETFYTPPFEILPDTPITVNPVILKIAAKDLQDITVTSKKQLLQVKPDRMVFNVQNSINASGSNALELLQKSPGVSVDNNDNISMKGKAGVRVSVDGKMIQLSAEDQAAYLRTINSNDIDAIEIISNPGARYDASGGAGIINIRLRKNASLGANGSLSAGFSQGITPKGNAAFTGNYRNNRVNIFSNLSAGVGKYKTDIIAPRVQKDTLYDQLLWQYSNSKSYNLKAGLDFFINREQTIGIMNTSSYNEDDWISYGSTRIIYVPSSEYVKKLDALNAIPRRRTSVNTNLNYRYADTSGREINVDIDHGLYRGRAKSYQPNYYTDKFNDPISEVITYNSTPTDIDIYSAKLDVTIRKWKGRLSYGIKMAYVRTDNTLDFYNDENGQKVKVPGRSYNFIYKENVNAGYFSFDRSYTEKWVLQAGLRIEQTNSEGKLTRGDGVVQNDNNVIRKYVDMFPNLTLIHKLNDNHRVSLSYARRVDRPNYQALNPFELKLDELSYVKGNSFLRPQYTSNIELTHTWNQLNTSIGYSHVKDLATQTVDTLNNFTYAYAKNLASQNILSANVSSPFTICKWWNGFANGWLSYQIFRGHVNGDPVSLELPVFGAFMQHNISLGKEFSAEVSGWFNGPSALGPTLKARSMGAVDVGVQKLLFNKRANLKITVTDIFRTAIPFRAKTDFGGLLLRFWVTRESQLLKVNFTYRFGNMKVKSERQRQAGLENETKRIVPN